MERDRHQWIADLQSDSPLVQEAAWKDLSRIVFHVACAYMHRRGDIAKLDVPQLAQDAAQEALADIMVKLGNFRGESKFTTWVYAFVINNTHELLRQRCPSVGHRPTSAGGELPSQIEIVPDSRGNAPETAAEEEELIRITQEIINTQLTERQRLILLRHIAGYSVKEIAEQLHVTPNNVYQFLHVARKRLKVELHARGYTTDWARSSLKPKKAASSVTYS